MLLARILFWLHPSHLVNYTLIPSATCTIVPIVQYRLKGLFRALSAFFAFFPWHPAPVNELMKHTDTQAIRSTEDADAAYGLYDAAPDTTTTARRSEDADAAYGLYDPATEAVSTTT